MNSPKTAITPTRNEDYPEWYQQVIKAADLAENSPVRGCMVIKPWGYGIWENIQRILNDKFKKTGHKNAYFPLFIPKSFLEKEAEHVEGFAKECAIVTHHRLEEVKEGQAADGVGKKGQLAPAGELEEPLVVRPTSETIIGAMFAKWVKSYRDLPLLINQWANVVRWEMRTRLFLRTTEFLWQEGHTVHATSEDAMVETKQMLDIYADFAENYMAMPVIKGEKTALERFPGAVNTYCIESMMQDRKALQAGTSHFLGQNFARSSQIKYLNAEDKEEYAWTTSWGVSTRLIGALIMTHSDDNGLILPPAIAPAQVVIIPIIRKDSDQSTVMTYCQNLKNDLEKVSYMEQPICVEIDDKPGNSGEKSWSWIKKGIPIRLEVGMRDISEQSVFMGRRDKEPRDKVSIKRDVLVSTITGLLTEIQSILLSRAKEFQKKHTVKIDSYDELKAFFTPKNTAKPEIHGGFALCHLKDSVEVEEKLKQDLNLTVRCVPLDPIKEDGKCLMTGEASKQRVILAKSY